MAFLGLDIGTTGVKSTVLDETGRVLGQAYSEYPSVRSGKTHVLNAKEVRSAVFRVIRDSAAKAGVPVKAVGISSFGESFVPVDSAGNPLYDIMLYTDVRGTEQCRAWTNRLAAERIAEISGAAPHPMYSLPKMMWFKENEPELYRRTYKFLLMEDFAVYCLTGECKIDRSLAARTAALDIRRNDWSDEILEAAGIEREKLSQPVPSGTVCGRILPERAAELGLPADAVVVTGAHDQVCAAVGVGALEAGCAVNGTGTVECITPVFDRPLTNPLMTRSGYACVPHAVDGLYVTYAFSFTGGALLKWFRDAFGAGLAAEAEKAGKNFYAHMDSRVSEAPSGLLILPHFAGAATPYMDPDSVGAAVGLHLGTGPDDLWRGLMEAVAYEAKINLERLAEAGIEVRELRATGGGAYSDVWLRMKADIFGKRVCASGNREAGTVGAVALAAAAVGAFPDLKTAATALGGSGKVFEPSDRYRAEYDELLRKYRKLYAAVKEVTA